MSNKQYSDAVTYCSQLINYCPEAVKFVCLKLHAYLSANKVSDAVEYSGKVQNLFIEYPEFIYWRGKTLMYSTASIETGKKYIREALNKDPDNVTYQKAWRNIAKQEKLKQEAN